MQLIRFALLPNQRQPFTIFAPKERINGYISCKDDDIQEETNERENLFLVAIL